jgi:WD40 repeat protein
MTTGNALKEAAALASPYPGLTSYTQENAAMFFGRNAERAVLISNLRASRLTLLYAQSGAGKSSVLRASVAAKLAELARRGVEERGSARYIPVVFSAWQDEPTGKLIAEIGNAIIPFLPEPSPPEHALEPLDKVITAASRTTGATLLVMLDQFEEYFLYRSREARNYSFADELAACINRADLRANFLISIREDAYSGLGDLFEGRIRNVYSNYLHLEHLTRESAREAIEKPIATFNELHQAEVPVEIEPGLVDLIIGQLGSGQFAPDQAGIGRLAGGNGSNRSGGEIAAPYLQLVMKRLWETEVAGGSRTLRGETLEQLGGAQTIVRTHVDHALGDLPEEAREAAVDVFRHLVTPSGTKIALAASDVAEYTGRPAEEAGALLERLAGSDVRILRPVPPPPGHDSGTRYEISHDLLAPAVLDWGHRRRAVRLEREKESAEREARVEKRRARMFRALALGAAALLVITIVALLAAIASGHTARHAELAAQRARQQIQINIATALLSQNTELSALLALHMLGGSHAAQAETVLRDALSQLQLKATLTPPSPSQSADPSPVRSAVFSPNGRLAATGSQSGTVTIWKAHAINSRPPTWTQLNVISVPGGDAVNGMAFSPDGRLLVTAGQSGNAYVWLVPSGLPRGEFTRGRGQPLNTVAFDPAKQNLVVTSGDNGYARIFNISTDRQVGSFGVAGWAMNAAAFSPDGRRIVTVGGDGYARVWNAATYQRIGSKFGYGWPMSSAAYSANGTKILTTQDNGYTNIWDATKTTPTVTTIIQEPGTNIPHDAAFSQDGSVVVTAGSDGTAREWNATTGNQVLTFAGHSGPISTVAFSGNELITASSDGTAKIWDAEPIEQRALLRDGTGPQIITANFSPVDPHIVATANGDGTVRVWNTSHQTAAVARLRVPGAVSAEFSADGKFLVTAGNEQVRIWRMTSLDSPFRVLNTARCANPRSTTPRALDSAVLSQNRKLLVTSDQDGAACVWNASTGGLVRKFTEPASISGGVGGGLGAGGSAMRWAVFSPNGEQVLTASDDGTARIWDVRTRTPLQVMHEPTGEAINRASFSPDGALLVTASNDGTARIWNATSGRLLRTLNAPGGSSVYNTAFSYTGSRIVTCSSSATVIWSTTGQQLTQFQYRTKFSDCAFSPDGREIVTAGAEGDTRIFSTELAGSLPQIKQIAHQRLTQLSPAERKDYLDYLAGT